MRLLPARLNDKPHYVFHPLRAARRAMHGLRPPGPDDDRTRVARLPWGLPLEVRTSDAIGYTILTARVFDPCVTETLHRIIDPGDLVVDAGANVGYMTGLAAARAGPSGGVVAYEPHPVVFELLAANVASWRARANLAPIELHDAALSDHAGTGQLDAGPAFDANMGLASLREEEGGANVVSVPLLRLDDALRDRRIGVLKIDVEGHEPAVLAGARELLEQAAIRDLVFEDHADYPSPATTLVEAAGYEVLGLRNDLLGVEVIAPSERGPVRAWPGPSYLATRDAERALARLGPRGWRVPGIGPGPRWLGRARRVA